MKGLIHKGNNVFEHPQYEELVKSFVQFAMVFQHRPEPTTLHEVTIQMGAGFYGYRLSTKPNCFCGERMYGIEKNGKLILLKFCPDTSD